MRLSLMGERCSGQTLARAFKAGRREAVLRVFGELAYWERQFAKEENANLFGGVNL